MTWASRPAVPSVSHSASRPPGNETLIPNRPFAARSRWALMPRSRRASATRRARCSSMPHDNWAAALIGLTLHPGKLRGCRAGLPGGALEKKLPPVLLVPLLAGRLEAEAGDRGQGGCVARADRRADDADLRLAGGPAEQGLQHRPCVPAAAGFGDHRVTNLDHAAVARR